MPRLVVITFLACMFAAAGSAAHAQGLPQGTYLQTCNNASVNGETLLASCQDANGNWVAAQLPGYQTCRGDVVNDNGTLRCSQYTNGYGQPGAYAVGGPFNQTCRSVRFKGDDLHAKCQATDGSWHDTKLDDYRKCRGNIINDNGNLRCVAAGAYGVAPVAGYPPAGYGGYQGVNGPAGSYLQSCEDVHVSGDDLKARCMAHDRRLRDASLDHFRDCRGDIVNDDGHLRCAAGAPVGGYYGNNQPYYGAAGVPGAINGPNGTYARTCTDIHVSGDDLKARCQSHDGNLHDAKLDDFQKCRSDIINDDGNLRCQR
ncbi:MAG TPA: CVNH domain-containing protein [Candidatus Angelobacter sp.]|jgi:hypothetical protein|nr:CVNH domain-containing protein [Candidatus Angelobacter sp.]